MKNENKEKHFELPFNKAIYEKDGDIHILDYIFADWWDSHLSHKKQKQGTRFSGAVGSVIRIITAEEIENRLENYDSEEIWHEAVRQGETTNSLEEYQESLKDIEGEQLVFEEASEKYYEAVEEAGIKLEEGERLEMTGGGRCFDCKEMIDDRSKIRTFNTGLYDFIICMEYGFKDMLEEKKASLRIDFSFEKEKKRKEQVKTALRHIIGLETALKNL